MPKYKHLLQKRILQPLRKRNHTSASLTEAFEQNQVMWIICFKALDFRVKPYNNISSFIPYGQTFYNQRILFQCSFMDMKAGIEH